MLQIYDNAAGMLQNSSHAAELCGMSACVLHSCRTYCVLPALLIENHHACPQPGVALARSVGTKTALRMLLTGEPETAMVSILLNMRA